MFGLFKPKELPKTIGGKIERVGAMPASEFELAYALKLQNNPDLFRCIIEVGHPQKYLFALSEPGDEVSFDYHTDKQIVRESFKNNILNLKF